MVKKTGALNQRPSLLFIKKHYSITSTPSGVFDIVSQPSFVIKMAFS
jgi:hypothetical protein